MPGLSEPEFMGCVSAFVDSLWNSLDGTAQALARLESRPKGAAFLFEMQLDQQRYGAVMILDRWERVALEFGPHVTLSRHQGVLEGGAGRIAPARDLLNRLNQLIDAGDRYTPELLAAAEMTFASIRSTFEAEHKAAIGMENLGPMLPEEYTAARRMFQADLAAR
ncbi:MAG: hypothetical protein FJW39_05345 [Acidobacteria bacterium]|nr:hypothetical protein [Acidobacteriota bacterium]